MSGIAHTLNAAPASPRSPEPSAAPISTPATKLDVAVAAPVAAPATTPPAALQLAAPTGMNRSIYNPLNVVLSHVHEAYNKTTRSSWKLFMARWTLPMNEAHMHADAQRLALLAFRRAERKVPAYKALVAQACGGRTPSTWQEVPETNKANYIKPAQEAGREASLYLGGKLPASVKRDTSTGTSGNPTSWYRGEAEQAAVANTMAYAAKVILGNRPFTCINGFALGPWATGVAVSLAMNSDRNASLTAVGPDAHAMWEAVKDEIALRPQGYPILLAGYPPHIRLVAQLARQEGFPLHAHNVLAAVGGEAMSEDLRDLIVAKHDADGALVHSGFARCLSSYGASDLDINIGYESDFEVNLRRACLDPKNRAFTEELFGKNEFVPMIFHYDPFNYFIETDAKQNLLFTCTREDRISPRVRYNLGDRGKLMKCSELLAAMQKHGITLPQMPRTNLPYVFIWGRQDAAVAFRAAKVPPENIGEAIRQLDATDHPGLNDRVAHHGFYQHEVDGVTLTEVHLELASAQAASDLDAAFLRKLTATLGGINGDLKAQLAACPTEEALRLRVFGPGESPMATQQTRYPMRKKQYVFRAGDEFVPAHAQLGGRLIAL